MDYKRGSKWRKWDLHVHTPNSIVQGYDGDNDDVWKEFVSALEKLPKEVKVVGITDYYFIDGYKKLMKYRKKGRLKNIEKIFPILEFRIDTFGSGNENKLQKINLHILFDVFEEDLESEIRKIEEEFIHLIPPTKLEKHKTKKLSKEFFISECGDLKRGFSDLIPSTERVFELLKSNAWNDKTFLFLGYKEWSNLEKNNQLKPLKQDLYEKVNAFLGSNIDTFNKSQEWLNEFGNKKLLHSLDIHSFNQLDTAEKNGDGNYLSSRNYKCCTWIKADPTFEGLKQIIYEPEERVFIGEEPELLKRVRENPTKFIDKIKINWIEGYGGEKGIWFKDVEIPLNYGMVSIIGNKGNGKSALADILALCGNSHRDEKDFSFLNKNRFLKNSLADNFQAELVWKSGENVSKNLSERIDYDKVEKVRYIPQGFFERLTNEIDRKEFEREIEKIIFSHIPKHEKLKQPDFEKLINLKKETAEKRINNLLEELKEINRKIVKLEEKANPSYKEKLESELKEKRKELEEVEKIRSPEVKNPKEDESISEEMEKQFKTLEDYRNNRKNLLQKIEELEEKMKEINIEISELESLKNDFTLLKENIEKVLNANERRLQKYNLNIDEIFKYSLDISKIEKVIYQKEGKKKKLIEISQSDFDGLPEESKRGNLRYQLKEVDRQIKSLSEKISEPMKKYQDYLRRLEEWEKRKNVLIGSEKDPNTIKWFEKQISYIESGLNNDLQVLEDKRFDIVKKIYEEKLNIINIYKQFKKVIDDKIAEYKTIMKDYKVETAVSFKIDKNFTNDFLRFIDKRTPGTYKGNEDGENALKQVLEEIDNFDDWKNVKLFLDKILKSLKFYNEKQNYIGKQVKKLDDFFDFLFSLEYLEPGYELKLGNKNLVALSPGERGALLIVFYLMLDKDDIPLIIDQPEENLDNESIYKILVYFIRDVKKRRQIIIVTHNPNLAIVGDSEQIIYVEIDKQNNNKFKFEAGSIENPKINEKCSRILEGTIKAFDIRRLKYIDFESREQSE